MAELIQPKVFSDIEDAMNSGAINTIKVNNVAQSITDKTVNLSVPSNAGDVGAYTKAETNGLLSNPNLLDNGWFNVNQRGVASYINAYFTVKCVTPSSTDTSVGVTLPKPKFSGGNTHVILYPWNNPTSVLIGAYVHKTSGAVAFKNGTANISSYIATLTYPIAD